MVMMMMMIMVVVFMLKQKLPCVSARQGVSDGKGFVSWPVQCRMHLLPTYKTINTLTSRQCSRRCSLQCRHVLNCLISWIITPRKVPFLFLEIS